MQPLLRNIAASIDHAFQQDATVVATTKRIPSSLIFQALRSIRPLLHDYFGGPIKCRFPGHRVEDNVGCSEPTPFRVLEYLLDFSFSRFSIPQAIGDPRTEHIYEGKFELLFAAESELGTDNEVCRDLLKLLDTRSVIRCLLFRKRRREAHIASLNGRLLHVLQHHAHFNEAQNGWLFVPLEIQHSKVHCTFHTLDADFNGFTQFINEI
ncbi:MAG TPA: hypothetical protein VIU12_08010 [Chryseolinea sp.]